MMTKTWAAIAIGLGLVAGTASAQATGSGTGTQGAGATGNQGAGGQGTGGATGAGRGTAGTGRGAAGDAVQGEGQGTAGESRASRGRLGGGQGAGAAGGAGGTMAMNDGLFAAAAAGSGMCEVASSRMALERASSPEVKQFAQRMLDDHTKANQELAGLASERQLAIPASLPVPAQAELNALAGVTGPEFDKCYVHQQMAAHIQAVGLFEAEAQRGQDPQLKAWAAKTVPTLKEHKMMVKRMHDAHESRDKSVAPASH